MLPIRHTFLRHLCAAALLMVLLPGTGTSTAAAPASFPERIQFNRDIRPIFSDTCFACHGPDAKARKGKLRLDLREDALRERDGKTPIVPGHSDRSEAFRRLTTTDVDDLMPPPAIHKTLSPRQIEMVRRWIDQGAAYESHWAYAPLPSAPPVPTPKGARPGRNPIDAFILERLAAEGLKPSRPADPITLVRRLHLDLTGLPPKPSDVDAFRADSSEAGYRRLVDRLLQSDAYAERMSVWWLDLVRYADSIGYHSDTPMQVWPYRDYVIQSFRANKPFDRFTIEQIAGDLMPEATQEQRVASTYNRLLQTTEEGGAQAKEYEFIYACDRVRNTAVAWMGATLLCSQCHDHKYDPFTMKDFYSFAAFFADIQEPIVGARGRGTLLPNPAQEREITAFDDSIRAIRRTLDTSTPELAAAQASWEKGLAQPVAWTSIRADTLATTSGTLLERVEGDGVRATGKFAEKDDYLLTAKVGLRGATGFRLEVLSDASLPSNGPGTASNGNFVLNEFSVTEGGPEGTNRPIALARASVDFSQSGYAAEKLIDGKRDTSGWAVLPEVGKDHVAIFELKPGFEGGSNTTVRFRLSFQSQFGQHLIGKLRLSVTTEPSPLRDLGLPAEIRQLVRLPVDRRSDAQVAELSKYYRGIAPALDGARKELASTEDRKRKFVDAVPSCLVTVAGPPREVRIHPRGNWMTDTGPVMSPAVPEVLGTLSTPGRATRLDLARWMVSPSNALTARVFVNRVWRLFFGTGLSKTLYDSGSQGELPSHLELLDWMSAEFIRSGWDVQALIRLMVTSSTYRQSSVGTESVVAHDPYNRLYARQSAFRLEAEFIRDNALAASGLLAAKTGGPSVFPYQPAGYWGPLNFPVREWQNSKGQDLHRRGLYTHWQRTFLHPSLAAFDACSREESTAERSKSNVPQQALAMLNDPAYVEASRVMAARVIREAGASPARRIDLAFRLAVGRVATAAERRTLMDLQARHLGDYRKDPKAATALLAVGESPEGRDLDPAELASWSSVTRTILNLHETLTRE